MKFIIFILLNLFVLSSCQTTGGVGGYNFGHGGVSDNDWNLRFYDNCGFRDNLRIMKEKDNTFYRFTLKNKDIGGCYSDRQARHGAPYWERAELKSTIGFTYPDKFYELTFDVRFVKGFTGDRETFWQFHAGSKTCKTSPILMLKFSSDQLVLNVSNYGNIRASEIMGKWNKVKVLFDTSDFSKYSVFFNGYPVETKMPFGISTCAIPYFKFGIYRPGVKKGKNETSIVDFDKFQLREIKNNENSASDK